jgi:hypothetical protein
VRIKGVRERADGPKDVQGTHETWIVRPAARLASERALRFQPGREDRDRFVSSRASPSRRRF